MPAKARPYLQHPPIERNRTMTARFPWGAGPAPPLDCSTCGHRIGKRRFHCIIGNTRVLCGRCMNQRHLHTEYYPDCRAAWHDMYDHGVQFATRAAAWYVLTENTSPERTANA
jgi:hypothetical protein